MSEKVRCLIIGSGPAGFTAAIYTSRANLRPVVYEGIQPGGQLTTTTEVDNFPGYPEGITGTELMEDLKKQAQRFGADIRVGDITKVDFSKRPFSVIVDDEKEIFADSVIASGMELIKFRISRILNTDSRLGMTTASGLFFIPRDIISR